MSIKRKINNSVTEWMYNETFNYRKHQMPSTVTRGTTWTAITYYNWKTQSSLYTYLPESIYNEVEDKRWNYYTIYDIVKLKKYNRQYSQIQKIAFHSNGNKGVGN